MGDQESMDVQVEAAGGQLFGGPVIPAGHVGIGLAFGPADSYGRTEVVRIVKEGQDMLRLLERLRSAVETELAGRAARVRQEAARGPLTVDAADRLLREGGFVPDTGRRWMK